MLALLLVVGLKTIRVESNIASAAPVQGSLLAVVAHILPVWCLDNEVIAIVLPDVRQGGGGQGRKNVDATSVGLPMDHHSHLNTRPDEVQERHFTVLLHVHHNSHLSVQTPGLDKRHIEEPVVERPVPLSVAGDDGIAHHHVVHEVHASHVGVVDFDDVGYIHFHLFLLIR